MQLIGKFKLNNIIYGIGINNDKYYVGKLKNNKLYTYLSDDEKTLVNYILDSLTPNKNIIEVTSVTLNDNQYKLFFNYGKNIFLFNPTNNINDLSLLNCMFNNQNEYVSLQKDNINNKSYFKRLVKAGKKTILVFLSSTFMLSNASVVKADVLDANKVDETKLVNIVDTNVTYDVSTDFLDDDFIYELPEVSYNYEQEDLVTFNRLKAAVNQNSNLKQEEKDLINQNLDIIMENKEFLNYPMVMSRLRTLKVEYTPKSKFYDVWNTKIAGEYYPNDNLIKIYKSTSLNDENKETFVHEFYHSLQNNVNNSFIIEALNSMCVNEYYGYDGSYEDRKEVIRLLSLVVGNDSLRQLNFNYSDELLVSILTNIIPDESLAENFLAHTYLYSSMDANTEKAKNLLSYMKDTISTYYEAKYNKNMDDDLLALMLKDKNEFAKRVGELNGIPSNYDISIIWTNEPNLIKRDSAIKNYSANLLATDPDNKISHYNALDREEAQLMGYLNDGKLDFNCYVDKTTGKIMIPVYEEQIITFEINESNRYLNNGIKR